VAAHDLIGVTVQLDLLGAYRPHIAPDSTAAFIERRLKDLAAEKRAVGWSDRDVEDALPDLHDELTDELAAAAIFELRVSDNRAPFLPSRLHTARRMAFGDASVAVLASGRTMVTSVDPVPKTERTFRVILLIYRWEPVRALDGAYGVIPLPPPGAVPDHVWQAIGPQLDNC